MNPAWKKLFNYISVPLKWRPVEGDKIDAENISKRSNFDSTLYASFQSSRWEEYSFRREIEKIHTQIKRATMKRIFHFCFYSNSTKSRQMRVASCSVEIWIANKKSLTLEKRQLSRSVKADHHALVQGKSGSLLPANKRQQCSFSVRPVLSSHPLWLTWPGID